MQNIRIRRRQRICATNANPLFQVSLKGNPCKVSSRRIQLKISSPPKQYTISSTINSFSNLNSYNNNNNNNKINNRINDERHHLKEQHTITTTTTTTTEGNIVPPATFTNGSPFSTHRNLERFQFYFSTFDQWEQTIQFAWVVCDLTFRILYKV